jgi:toxin ParE1/3/4
VAEAQQWLEDIFEYIVQDNPPAAAHTVQAIYEQAQDLIAFPQLGYRYAASSQHVRILLHEQYRIAYLLRDDRDIDILGVFHGALDIERYQL